jgi:surface polysaccharide O-acyltransferase-like enzyme
LLSDEKVESIPVFYKKRANRLLIPILFWSIIFLALFILKGIVKGHGPSIPEIGDRLLSVSPYFYMCFLYIIIGLYLVNPYIRIIIRHTSNSEL